MALGLEGLKSELAEGARANKYKIQIAELGGEDVSVLAKAGSLPGRTIGTAEVFSQGRKVPLAGDTTYDTWDVTFYGDKDLKIWGKVDTWMKDTDDYAGNTSSKSSIADYGKSVIIQQLDRKGAPTKGVTLENAWITTISPIDYGADSNDTVVEYTVTFNYTHYTVA